MCSGGKLHVTALNTVHLLDNVHKLLEKHYAEQACLNTET